MDKLYEFTFPVVLLRLVLAMVCGGIIGYGRSRRRKAAGFRTYMLVAIGGCMTVLMSLYYHEMMHGNEIWTAAIAEVGEKFDGVRFAAQAVTGIGFLASGTGSGTGYRELGTEYQEPGTGYRRLGTGQEPGTCL